VTPVHHSGGGWVASWEEPLRTPPDESLQPPGARSTPARGSRVVRAGCLVIALPLLIVLSPVIALVLAWKEISRRALEREFTRRHGPDVRGMLVYSNSPNWQVHVEREWIPRLRGRLVVMNWSERARWDRDHPVESKLFRQLGDRDFNPAAIIFRPPTRRRPFRRWLRAIRELDPVGVLAPYQSRVDVVRFFRPFRDYKHGREHALRAAERRLWVLLGDEERS